MKLVLVPLTTEALRRLDLDESLPGDIVELELSDEDYALISKSGVLDKINSSLGKMLDEYEDESIQGRSSLSASLTIFNEAYNATRHDVISRIISMNELAIENDTGMFFYL